MYKHMKYTYTNITYKHTYWYKYRSINVHSNEHIHKEHLNIQKRTYKYRYRHIYISLYIYTNKYIYNIHIQIKHTDT